jgi:hypothetical protein
VSPEAERYNRLLALYRGRVNGYVGVADDFSQRWSRWCRHLLTYGGDLVVPPLRPEPDLDSLLTDARPQQPGGRVVLGEDNACHANAAVLWTDGAIAAIGSGYALSDDGLWRPHSWGVDIDGTAVETTAERQMYVGVTLTGVPALRFAVNNAGDHVKTVLRAQGPRTAN